MALGITRSEQAALLAVVGLIVAGLAVQDYQSRAANRPTDDLWIESDPRWQPIPIPSAKEATRPELKVASNSVSSTTPTLERKAIPSATSSSPAAININTATAEELDRLPGIGPSKAQLILDYRKKIGPFRSVDQLDEVKGIGPKTLERLRPYVTVGDPSAPTSPATGEKIKSLPAGSHSSSRSPAPKAVEKPGQKININTADLTQLQTIPGIGPKLAERIVRHRMLHPFKHPEDLIKVEGIGQKNFEKMRLWISVAD